MKILYFAWLKEHTEQGAEELQLPDGIDTVGALIPHLTKQSAGHAAALADLEAVTAELETVADKDHDAIVRLAMQYLEGVARGVQNRFMFMTLVSLNNLIGASLSRVIARAPEARARIIEAQREISAALAAGDAKSAKTWMRKHIDDLKRGYEIAGVAVDTPVSV